jgi:hypothetical protein
MTLALQDKRVHANPDKNDRQDRAEIEAWARDFQAPGQTATEHCPEGTPEQRLGQNCVASNARES